MSAERPFQEEILQEDIDKLKNSTPYQEKFGTPETGDLQQAIDILRKLRGHAATDSTTGYRKLDDAIGFLEGEMKKQVEAEK